MRPANRASLWLSIGLMLVLALATFAVLRWRSFPAKTTPQSPTLSSPSVATSSKTLSQPAVPNQPLTAVTNVLQEIYNSLRLATDKTIVRAQLEKGRLRLE